MSWKLETRKQKLGRTNGRLFFQFPVSPAIGRDPAHGGDCFQFPSLGFSIIEFIVVIGIVMIVTIAMTRFSSNVLSLNRATVEGLRAQEQLRKTLSKIAGELRDAQTGATGSYSVASIATSSLTFFSDVTGDGVPERLHYFVSGEKLMQGVTVPEGSPLTYGEGDEKLTTTLNYLVATTTPVFTYYDGSYTGSGQALALPADVSKVRMVGISLTVDKDKNEPPQAVTASTFTTIRALKDNL